MEEKKESQPDKKKAFSSGANMFHTSSSLPDEDYDDGEILKVQPIANLFPSPLSCLQTMWGSLHGAAAFICFYTFGDTVQSL